MSLIPKQVETAISSNPSNLVLFGKPKCGKTAFLTRIKDNLILDLESGSRFEPGLKINVKELAREQKTTELTILLQIREDLEKEGKVYKAITFDTITALEEIVEELAVELYRDTPMGKSYGKDLKTNTTTPAHQMNIKSLPNGAGYLYIREAYFKVINSFSPYAECIIQSGHLKDKAINKEGKDLNSFELNLAGKLSGLVCAKADAVGYVFRNKNQTVINFKPSELVICGARPAHLREKEIVVAEGTPEGNITIFEEKIFLPE